MVPAVLFENLRGDDDGMITPSACNPDLFGAALYDFRRRTDLLVRA